MKNSLVIISVCLMTLSVGSGCQNKAASENMTQMQQQINDLDSQVKKMAAQMTILQQDVTEMKQAVGKVKQDVQKVQPNYIGGNVQEGTH